jgi:thymidylate synthase
MAVLFQEDSLDDLLRAAIQQILDDGEVVAPTKGANRELRGATLQLTAPRARMSRSESRGKIFSALGELLWYLSGSNSTEHIAHYIPMYRQFDEAGVVFGGYGPRLRHDPDQLRNVIELLRKRRTTRRAVIQLFAGTDLLVHHEDVPCTCTLQFLHRKDGLDLVVYMRSNDVFLGLPHDVFCFTMIQEIVARAVGAEVGQYIHAVGSLHLYDSNLTQAERFLSEGFFATNEMPPMPQGDPMQGVEEILGTEEVLRRGVAPLSVKLPSIPYWADLARLLVVFELDPRLQADEIESVAARMTTRVYDVHVADRVDRANQ